MDREKNVCMVYGILKLHIAICRYHHHFLDVMKDPLKIEEMIDEMIVIIVVEMTETISLEMTERAGRITPHPLEGEMMTPG
mgnify:FL=1